MMIKLLKSVQLTPIRRTILKNCCDFNSKSLTLLSHKQSHVRVISQILGVPRFAFTQIPDKEESGKAEKQEVEKPVIEEIKLNRFRNANDQDQSKNGKQEKEEDEEMTPIFKVAILSIGACALYIFYKLNEMQSQLKKIDDVRVSHKGQAQIGQNWELIDTSGKPINPLSLYGKFYLVYFGFCHCPDICPANLIKIRNAINRIKQTPEGQKQDIKVLFISVDPERDSPQTIRDYLDTYDPSFLGATGLPEDESKLKDTLKSFKVVANKINYDPDDEELKVLTEKYNGDTSKIYTMDHTTNTFLMGPQGEFINFYDGNRPEEELASQVLQSMVKYRSGIESQIKQ